MPKIGVFLATEENSMIATSILLRNIQKEIHRNDFFLFKKLKGLLKMFNNNILYAKIGYLFKKQSPKYLRMINWQLLQGVSIL